MLIFQSGLYWALVLGSVIVVTAQENNIEERGLRDSIKQITNTVSGMPSLGKFYRSVNMTEIARASTKVAKELSKSLRMDVFAVGKALAAAGAAMGSVVFLGGMAGLLATGLGMFRYSPDLYNSGYFSNRIGDTYPTLPTFNDAQALIYQKVQQAQQQYLNEQNKHSAGAPAQRIGAVHTGHVAPGAIGARPQQDNTNNKEYYGERNDQQSRAADGEDLAMSARDVRVLKETKKPYSDDLVPALMDLFQVVTNNLEKAAPEVVKALRR